MERVLVLVKPDGVERGLTGAVIKRYEEAGLKVIGLKIVNPSEALVGSHYVEDKDWMLSVGQKTKQSAADKGIKMTETEMEIGARVRRFLMKELSRVVVAIVFEGNAAAEVARKIAGSTEPRKADPSTIRGTYSTDSYALADLKKRSVRNILHVSETAEIAAKEIKVWFKESELAKYKRTDEDVLYG